MMQRIVMLAMVLVLAGCNEGSSESSSTVGVGEGYTVDKLFTKDGCTVYRFRDGGYNRYFTNCSGSTIGTNKESCGRACTKEWDVSIPGGGHQ